MGTIIILAAIVGLAAGIYKSYQDNSKKKEAVAYYKTLPGIVPNFTADKVYLNMDGLGTIALCVEQRKVIDCSQLDNHPKVNRSFSFDQIIKTDVVVDGKDISSKSAGGALVGGLMFGTVGAVVGSNTGKTTHKKDVKSIKLKIVLKDIYTPSVEIPFYEKN